MSWNAAYAHPVEVVAAHRRVLDRSPARDRYIDVGGRNVHVIERGEGPPLVLLHGTNMFASLMRHFTRVYVSSRVVWISSYLNPLTGSNAAFHDGPPGGACRESFVRSPRHGTYRDGAI